MKRALLLLLFAAAVEAQHRFTVVGGGSGGGGGTGTVTSVALTAPAQLTVTGSPILTAGTIGLAWASATQGTVFAGPCANSGTPVFRALCAADVPTISQAQVTNLTTDLAARVLTTRTITAGSNLTGGGDLSASRTIALSPTLTGLTSVAAATFTGALVGNVTGNVSGSSGSTTGNAATATALAANGTNCSAGNYPLGVDSQGNAESCTAAGGGASLPVADSTAIVEGSTDATKEFRVEIDGIATGTTVVMTPPATSFTAARTDAAQSFEGRQTFNGFVLVPNGSDRTNMAYGMGATTYGIFSGSLIGISLGGTAVWGVDKTSGFTTIGSGRVYGWSAGTDPDETTNMDTGFARLAAGVIGVGNGDAASVNGAIRATWTEGVVGANVASGAVIAPPSELFHVTGTATITTITPPRAGYTGCIRMIPDDLFTTATGGNIALASTAVVNRVLILCYDGTSWFPSY